MNPVGYMILTTNMVYFYCCQCQSQYWTSMKGYAGRIIFSEQLGNFGINCGHCSAQLNPNFSETLGWLFALNYRVNLPNISRLEDILNPEFTLEGS